MSQVDYRFTEKLVAGAALGYAKTDSDYSADGGNIALTAQSDRYTATSWADVGIGPHSMTDLEVTDFDIIDTGAEIALTYDCVRSHPILLDGFELGSLWRWLTP